MKVREIEFGDAFLASKLLQKIDLKKLLVEVGMKDVTGWEDAEREKAIKEKAFDFFIAMLAHIDGAEKEITNLLAAWAQITPDDVKKLKLSELKEFAEQFVAVNNVDAITRFFKKAAVSK